MTGKTQRELWVTVPVQTEWHYLIETDLTDKELQSKLESSKGNFLEIMNEFQILDSEPSEYEDYDDRNETVIKDDDGNTIAYYNPNESC